MEAYKLGWISLLVFTVANTCAAERCFQCQNLPHPRDCVRVVSCAADETCFTEEVVTTSGDIVFNSGCMPKLQCVAIGKRNTQHRRAGDITTCIHCCDGGYCNNEGCGASEIPRDQRGPYCYSCPVTWATKCNKVVTCATNEICALHTPKEFFAVPEVVFETSCMPKLQCGALLNSHANTNCIPTCCNTDFCNDKCNASSASVVTPAPITVPTSITPAATTLTPAMTCPGDHMHDPVTGLCIRAFSVTHPLSWTAAQAACQSIGDHLVDVNSQQKMDFIQHSLAGTKTSLYWIGGRDQYDNETYIWSNGQKFSYTNWGGGHDPYPNKQPDHGDQDCVGVYVLDNFQWHDDPCSHPWDGYICERSNIQPVVKTFECKTTDGYMDLGRGLCVHVHVPHHMVTWQQARDQCIHEHADLVVIDTKAKRNYLNHYLDNKYNTKHFWVGAHDTYNNDTFMWVNGQSFTYNDWWVDHTGQNTQPNHYTGDGKSEDCMAVYHYQSRQHHWVDDQCSHQHNFVCQRS